MSLTYAIPDIHGRLDLLDAAIEIIAGHSSGQSATVVTLGDYVDRGPNSRQVIERLMQFGSPNLALVALKGNHEAMMWEACNGLVELDWWTVNGGGTTLASFGGEPGAPDPGVVPSEHLEWIDRLPLMHVDKHRVFVHAGVDPHVLLRDQNVQTLLWKRYPDASSIGHGQRHVVHGHHATLTAPVIKSGRTNLDGGAWLTGRLVVGVFDDELPGGPTTHLEVFGEPARENES